MSTFGGLSIAGSGLAAARAALEVTGQNVANANTEGYTRQRVDLAPMTQTALATFSKPTGYGDGVLIAGVSRMNDAVVDARVNSTASGASYWSTSAAAVATVETSLNEPSTNGLASQLNAFWNDWQVVANNVGGTGASGAANQLIQQGTLVASTISAGYDAASNAWTAARTAADSTASTINSTAANIVDLNKTIRSLSAAGGNVNSLLDQRDAAVTTLAKLTGAAPRGNADGTIDVVVGGNTLVSGVTSRSVQVGGAASFSDAVAGAGVSLVWTDSPTTPVALDGGEMAARIASLQPAATSGTGGVFAEAAKAYDDLATSIATVVNDLHTTGVTPGGTPGGKFFDFKPSGPAATSLFVVPTSVDGIAAAGASKGTRDNSIADEIAQIGSSSTVTHPDGTTSPSPNSSWSMYVARIGTQSATASARASTSAIAANAATTAQNSVSGVDLDEETSNLVLFQHAYQASARVISTINDVLDTLITMGAR